ncbi:MAG: V-type ATP synthase subunit E [Clostridium sp.]|uniref:V-type ATP synthase subunit E n=1 Tax=Clostridium TaxID=1485 RepID=UPI002153108A|nr:V-type ATP synthase subunit E [Clostridium sp. LY3-2]MCR6516008.1 V-type ATP synthase subunit E [Clostridium sp. LY3-2]
MSVENIKKLTSKITSDAEAKRDSILAKANEEKAKILEKKEAEARKAETEMILKSEAEAKTRKERIVSSAELKVRNEKLEAKQNIISQVFEMSVESLCKMSDAEIKKFVMDTILNSQLDGDEKVIISQNEKGIITEEFIKEVNSKLSENGRVGELTLAKEVRNFKGGFILEKNGVEINNTFEALVSALRDELEFEVASVLFN